jgi:hypothetical protein
MNEVKSQLKRSPKDVSLTDWRTPYENIKVTFGPDRGIGTNITTNVTFKF